MWPGRNPGVIHTCDPGVMSMLPGCHSGVTFVHQVCNLGGMFAVLACYYTHIGCNPGVTGLCIVCGHGVRRVLPGPNPGVTWGL